MTGIPVEVDQPDRRRSHLDQDVAAGCVRPGRRPGFIGERAVGAGAPPPKAPTWEPGRDRRSSPSIDAQSAIAEECERIADLLIEKNKSYGNSALDPVRIFSQADRVEQLKVRIDDKLSRLARGVADQDTEDVELDLIGYLVLLRVSRRA